MGAGRLNMHSMLATLVQSAGTNRKASSTVVNTSGERDPPLVLFHAAASICSQKVRAVLAHHGLAYVSQTIDLFSGETYDPDYIRLRMIGCRSVGGSLASRHTGSTALSSGGCDGIAVPTLVDLVSEEVIVDSRAICTRLDAMMPAGQRLRPPALAKAVDLELTIVDELPNYQLLMARPRGTDGTAPDEVAMAAFSRRKVAWCDTLIARFPDDEDIVTACTAKRAKELSAAEALFTSEALAHARDLTAEALAHLNTCLAQGSGWVLGDRPTLADLVWAVELLRIENVGQDHFWADGRNPHIPAFLAAARELPAIRQAVIDWPGAMF